MSELKMVNFLKGLERLKSFFEDLEKFYPKLIPNELEKKKAEAIKAVGLLELLCKDLKEICCIIGAACDPNILKVQREYSQELLKNICNRMDKDKCDPNTAQMQSQAAPGSDKSETETH